MKWKVNELRKWQKQATDRFTELFQNGKREFLFVASPASGKTILANKILFDLKRSEEIDFTIIITPTSNLRKQWAKETRKNTNLEFRDDWNGTYRPLKDYDGIVCTYAKVDEMSLNFKDLISRKDTLVIFDEIHHAGEKRPWGKSLGEAFSKSKVRLSLSGTPLRTDNQRIPFLDYEKVDRKEEEDEYYKVSPDFSYSYAKAVQDKVCREIIFQTSDGLVEWQEGDARKSFTFQDNISQRDENKRLRYAIDPNLTGVEDLLEQGIRKLNKIQKRDPKAKGLIFAADQSDARKIKSQLKELTGEEPAIAISDKPDASDIITQFSNNRRPWLVSVKMVSEGIDIPSLRVGVYCSPIKTFTTFKQRVGRFIRYESRLDSNQDAFLIMPEDPTLKEMAKNIRKDLEIITNENDKDKGGKEPGTKDPLFSQGISADLEESNTIYKEEEYSKEDLSKARLVKEKFGFENSPPVILEGYKKFQELEIKDSGQDFSKSIQEKKKDLRNMIEKAVDKFVYSRKRDGREDVGKLFQVTHQRLNTRATGRYSDNKQEKMTKDELEKKKKLALNLGGELGDRIWKQIKK